jgi:iron complex outermembrane receptor protein
MIVYEESQGDYMNYPIILIQIMAILPLLTGTVFAESAKAAPSEYTLDEVVVTSEKIQDYIKNHPLDVNVVERKEIVGRNLPNVEEILKTMQGVEVYSTSGVGSRISIRGSGRSSGVLILLNGRPLNSNQYGSQDLNSIPVDMIESVSVFKPPVPVWLGPGGSDGAINIVTRAPKSMKKKEKHRTTVKGGGGSFGFIEGGLTHLLPVAGGNTLLSGTATHRDGKRANSDRTDGALSLNWNREGIAGAKYEVNGRYYQAEYGSPGPLDNPTPNARQEYRKGSVDSRYSGIMGETGTVAATAYGDLVSVKDHSQSGATSSLDDHKLGLKLDTTWSEPEGGWDLRVGGMTEWDVIDHTLSGEHQRFRNGVSGQYDRRFGALTATVGLRGDVANGFGFNPGFSSGVGWGVSEKTLLKARAGYTVNVPSFEQLYQTSHGSIDQTRGNPDLKEEQVWSYDLGIEHTFGKDRLVQLMLFRADTFDLITSRRGADKIYRPVNISAVERQGIELTGKYGWETGLTVEASCTFQSSKDKETGNDLPYTPAIKLKSTVRYTLPSLKTRLEGTIRYEGARYGQLENLPSQRLSDYAVVDIKATHPFSIARVASDLYVRMDNLFNTPYETHLGYPNDGIRFTAGIQMRFQ